MSIKPHIHVLQRMSEIAQGDLYVDSFLALATKSHEPNLPAITRAHQDYIDACLSAAEAVFNIEKARAEFIRSLETPSPSDLHSTSTVTSSNPTLDDFLDDTDNVKYPTVDYQAAFPDEPTRWF